MKSSTILQRIATGAFLLAASALQASLITLTPGNALTTQTAFPTYTNPDASDVEAILLSLGVTVDLTELYRSNAGGAEEYSFADSYSTAYTAGDEEATISWDGAPDPYIMDGAYALAKDGNHTPIWYLWDLSALGGWDGQCDITFEGLWPAQGSISHVSIFGDGEPDSPPGSIPEAGSSLALLGMGMALFGFLSRRKA